MTIGYVQMPSGPPQFNTDPYVVKIPVVMDTTANRYHLLRSSGNDSQLKAYSEICSCFIAKLIHEVYTRNREVGSFSLVHPVIVQ